MTTGKNKNPKQVEMSSKQANELKERIKQNNLTECDLDTFLGLIAFNLWLQERLARAKLSIKRLRNLFGFKNESRKKSKKSDKEESSDSDDKGGDNPPENNEPTSDTPEENTTQNKAVESPPQWDSSKNHGRYGANDYTGCPVVHIPFENQLLKEGKCPECAECNTDANLHAEDPTVLIFLESQPLISGQRYALEKGRCAVCQAYFTAPMPEALENQPKYSNGCITSLAIMHYYAGLPFKRIETLQNLQGAPLADATQYDLMNKLYQSIIKPITAALRQYAANGKSLFFDDTSGRILEQITQNKNANTRQDKKGVHTTALLSDYQGHRIYLFNTNTLTAGKQLASLLKDRTSDDDFMTMSDASASNFPTLNENLLARWVITLCLSHGRRRFVELLDEADDDVQFIVDIIAQVYQHEKHCKQAKLNDEERLVYHQKHSAPLMSALQVWFNNLLLYKEVEPNSRLGEAIIYMLKRWQWLTQFLRVPGAQLDNNICEIAIKVVIRYRKNSLFYRTFYGASVGDAMMSVLHTAAHAGINIFTYLNTLQQYAEQVQSVPEDWLPWNYQQTLAALEKEEPEPVAVNTT